MLCVVVAEKIIAPAIDDWADDMYEEGMDEINNPKPPPPPPPKPNPICVRGRHNDNRLWG